MMTSCVRGLSRGAVLLGVLCLGCSEGGTGPSLNFGGDPSEVVFVSLQSDPNAWPEALYQGGLLIDDEGCLRLQGWSSNPAVVWPTGYRLSSIDGRLFIRDAQGEVRARLDADFQLGGGEMQTVDHLDLSSSSRTALATHCPGTYYLASPFN